MCSTVQYIHMYSKVRVFASSADEANINWSGGFGSGVGPTDRPAMSVLFHIAVQYKYSIFTLMGIVYCLIV